MPVCMYHDLYIYTCISVLYTVLYMSVCMCLCVCIMIYTFILAFLFCACLVYYYTDFLSAGVQEEGAW